MGGRAKTAALIVKRRREKRIRKKRPSKAGLVAED